MKRLTYTLVALMAVFPLFAQEEDFSSTSQNDTTETLGVHPFDASQNYHVSRQYANWSIIPHVGFNLFDGDFHKEMKHAVSYPSAGLDIEYTFTPVFSLGVEYMYSRYGAWGNNPDSIKPKKLHADTLLYGHMHKVGGYLSMDLIGLFYPHGQSKLVSLNAILGAGYGFYKTTAMYHDDKNGSDNPTHNKWSTLIYVNADGQVGRPDYMTKYEGDPFLQFGANLEFNLNRTLALGLRASYCYYFTDQIDGRGYAGEAGIASKNNDGILDVTLNMRIKLTGKEHSHVRNIGGNDPNLEIAKRVAALENASLGALAPEVHDTLIIYHDTIIEIRDMREPREEPVVIQQVVNGSLASNYYIYFSTGKAKITDAGLAAIQQVADRMREDASLYAVVTGYCDNTGSDKVNYLLGDKRAENVMDELVAEYDIPADHVYAAGVGKLIGKRSKAAYAPNRRAVIQLVNEDTYLVLSSELADMRAKREAEMQSQKQSVEPAAKPAAKPIEKKAEPKASSEPVAVTAKPEVPVVQAEPSPYPMRDGEEIVVSKNISLAQLARQYYNNTHCWVYIFLANEQIVNPNVLQPEMVLHLPELTEEEMSITKEECAQLYQSAKRL